MHWHQADTKLVEMIVAIEDRRFRNHPGVDVIALGRVVINNIRSGEIM
ncbi:transglycosylase domain-containing protein [Patescibacteria group bacterium]|nr:transglycosylase domain-containing protein [Patescibacteria group bacterium]